MTHHKLLLNITILKYLQNITDQNLLFIIRESCQTAANQINVQKYNLGVSLDYLGS